MNILSFSNINQFRHKIIWRQVATMTTLAALAVSIGQLNSNQSPFSVQAAYCDADLVVTSFTLTNSAGVVKSSFNLNEAIFVKTTFKNQGANWSRSANGHTYTQIYSHKPNAVAIGVKSDVTMSMNNGEWPAGWTKSYSSYPYGENGSVFEQSKSWTKSTAGNYIARIYFNYDGNACESNNANNQRTVAYTVGNPTTPTPTPAPTPTTTLSPTPTPTPNSATIFEEAYPNHASLIGSTGTNNWKNSSFYVKSTMRVSKVAFYQAGANNAFELRASTSTGSFGTVLAKGNLSPSISSNGYYEQTIPSTTLTAGQYYIFRVYTTNGRTYFTNSYRNGTNLNFRDGTLGSNQVQNMAGVYAFALGYSLGSNSTPTPTPTPTPISTPTPKPTTTPAPTPKPSITPTPWPANTTWPQPVKDPTSYSAIVNKKFKLSSSYVPNDLYSVGIPYVNNQPMRKVAADALWQMRRDATYSGVYMRLRSGYRSYATQNSLYWNYVNSYGQASADTFSARPGHSEHQTGLTADLSDQNATGCDLAACFANTKAGKWLAANAHKYGYIIRYQPGKESITGYMAEPWHIRYVGASLATTLKNSGKTMEEHFGVPGGNYR